MELSAFSSNCKLFTVEQASVDGIDSKPAVYAFYDLLRFTVGNLRHGVD